MHKKSFYFKIKEINREHQTPNDEQKAMNFLPPNDEQKKFFYFKFSNNKA